MSAFMSAAAGWTWPGSNGRKASTPTAWLYGLSGALAQDYLQAMGVAARYAWFNRMALAELVRKELAGIAAPDASRLIVDVPHNVVMTEGEFNVHRKGSTPAHDGQWALIPGSMGDYSFLVKGLGHEDWLSCSHGAGRQVRRQDTPHEAAAGRIGLAVHHLARGALIEEAPAPTNPWAGAAGAGGSRADSRQREAQAMADIQGLN
jgi:tRNA-splicing ligase RtcB